MCGGFASLARLSRFGLRDLRAEPALASAHTRGIAIARGTLAMARTMVPDSATAQFFINVKDNDFLNAANARDGNGYAVFGKVVAGMDVVDKIKGVATGNKGMHQNVPVEPVVIKTATVEK